MAENSRKFVEPVAGKVVEKIILTNEPELREVEIRFQDKTAFSVLLNLQLEVTDIELKDWTDGEEKVIKKFL